MSGEPWTEEEDQIIRDKYPRYGSCCQEHLPRRTIMAIQKRALYLGVACESVRSRGKPYLSLGGPDNEARSSALRYYEQQRHNKIQDKMLATGGDEFDFAHEH